MITQRLGSQGAPMEYWQFTVNTEATAAGEKTTGIPFNLYNQPGISLKVDWGDGTTSTLTPADYAANDSRASVHEYATPGVYTITVGCAKWEELYILVIRNTTGISSINNGVVSLYWWRRSLVSVDSAIPNCSGVSYYTAPVNISYASKANNQFMYLFAWCSFLASIPIGLFDNNPKVTAFNGCFYNCSSLTVIPTGLFDNHPKVTTFSYCFYGCSLLASIPTGLFDNNTRVTNFSYCFYGCSSITSIPAGLFNNNTAVTDFAACFYGCSSLTSIPTGLFDNNPAVTNFSYCFQDCSSLTAIPTGLFDNNTRVTNFSYCFYGCSSITSIPTGLFDNNTAVTNFSSCFRNCSSITAIPTGLFDNNTAVTNFSYCFRNSNSFYDFSLTIGSSLVSNATSFVTNKPGTTRTISVPVNSTTETTFNRVATNLGLTIIGV